MDNPYLKAQCQNMVSALAAFSTACELAAYGTVLPMESELFGGKAVSLSERLAEDHIRTWSNEGDLVLAPFDKDGTVAKIAPLLERRWLSLQNAADCDGLRDNAG